MIHTTRWDASTVIFSAIAAGTQAVNVLPAGRPPETVLRTRGHGLVYVDGVQTPDGMRVLVSMGLVIVPQGQGTTVIWDPFGDPNAPWFWFHEEVLAYEEMVVDVIDSPLCTAARIEVDSKAMRKANDDEEVQFVMTNTTLGTASSVNASIAFRFLIGH